MTLLDLFPGLKLEDRPPSVGRTLEERARLDGRTLDDRLEARTLDDRRLFLDELRDEGCLDPLLLLDELLDG